VLEKVKIVRDIMLHGKNRKEARSNLV
jgi:hypothetical protein